MRLVTYLAGEAAGVGVELAGVVRPTGFRSMRGLIAAGSEGLTTAAASAAASNPVAIDRLLAPLPDPGKIFGGGVNFRHHGIPDPAFVLPTEPRIDFIKLPSAVIGPGGAIVIPGTDATVIHRPGGFNVDYEVELAVVFGWRAYRVSRTEALTHVFGYTIVNDVSSRQVQLTDRQADLGKNFDTFLPMGPAS